MNLEQYIRATSGFTGSRMSEWLGLEGDCAGLGLGFWNPSNKPHCYTSSSNVILLNPSNSSSAFANYEFKHMNLRGNYYSNQHSILKFKFPIPWSLKSKLSLLQWCLVQILFVQILCLLPTIFSALTPNCRNSMFLTEHNLVIPCFELTTAITMHFNICCFIP